MDRVIDLADGRSLGVSTYGDPQGTPVLLFHGTPGSRLWVDGDDSIGIAEALAQYLRIQVDTRRVGHAADR